MILIDNKSYILKQKRLEIPLWQWATFDTQYINVIRDRAIILI